MRTTLSQWIPYLAILVLFSISCKEQPSTESKKYLNIGKRMEQEFMMIHDPALQTVPAYRLLNALQVKEQKLSENLGMLAPVPSVAWEERGPNNVGGRTRAVIFDLNDAVNDYKKVWAGGVSGGLWYTNDITAANPVWNKVDDFLDNLAISAIVQDPFNPNIMFAGTGEGWFNADAVQGAGIWKSTNAGASWTHLPSTSQFYFVQDLAIDMNGHLYATTRTTNSGLGASGLMKSTDGGATWVNVLNTPLASSNRGADIEVAANGDIYVSMGTTGVNGGIYKSDFSTHGANTGNSGTWVNITPNAAGTISTPNNFWHRIELAVAPSDPHVVYALFQGYGSSNVTSIQKYDAVSNSWTVRTVPTIFDQGSNSNFTRGQAWYDLIAAVHPDNPNTVYIGGVDALRSTDGGQTWEQITTWSMFKADEAGLTINQHVHADHHVIVFAPGSPSRMLLGTDGGIYYTTNANAAGKPSFISRNTGFNVTQYYSAYMHPSQTNKFFGGTQDNGTHMFSNAGLNDVVEVTGGDGGYCFVDEDNPNQVITTYTYNNYHISTNGGTTFSSRNLNNRGSFINPMDYDHANNTIYAADNAGRFYRWKNVFAATPVDTAQITVGAFNGAMVTHVRVSPNVPNRVYFGLNNGSVVRVDDAHTPGSVKTGVVIRTGTGSVSSIAIDSRDENHMLVTYSNYGVTSVFETFNANLGSPTWISVEGDLPDMPVRWALFDPRNSDWALLATELGIWSTDDLNGASTSWSPTNSGLANVRVDMIRFRSSDNTLLAATHGRGIFTAVLPPITTPDINFVTSILPVSETGSSTDGDCREFTEYQFYIGIENPPTGDAIVTLNVTGSATRGVDYDFTTNGDFSSPSDVITFADGVVATHPITVRVYDDAETEGTENAIFTYTLSGSTNAQSGLGNQQFVLQINDNDEDPKGNQSLTQIILNSPQYYLSGNGDAQVINSALTGKRTMLLYTASELQAMGFTAGNINAVGFFFEKNSTRSIGEIQVKMGTTPLVNFDTGMEFAMVTTTPVGSYNNYTVVSGLNVFNLSAPFAWNGVDNVVIEICYTNSTEDSTQIPDRVLGYVGENSSASYMYWNNINCATNWTMITYYNGYKPILYLSAETYGSKVATAVTGRTEYFTNGNTLNYYNENGEIIASVKNLSGHDFGCMEVEIDRAGNGAKPFWNNNAENYVMDKTFYFNPASNLPSGTYEVTLYFSPEEVAGWEAATGNTFNDIQLIKTKGRVSAITPATPVNPDDVEVVVPQRGTLGTAKTLKYTFSTGFSGFAAGIVGEALPVKWDNFEGKYQAPDVQLKWEVSLEQNNSGFEVEKSEDGRNFRKIGFVPSVGDHHDVRQYSFADKNVFAVNNYYRLRQIDLDGRATYSTIINVRKTETALMYKVMQNPVEGDIVLQFNAAPGTAVEAVLFDNAGKQIRSWKVQQLNTLNLRLQMGGNKPAAGAYVLQLKFQGKVYSEKLIIK